MAEITAQAVNEFRKKTGLGLMECKTLLKEADGDEKRAIELAKAKHGKNAENRAGRATNAGRIEVYVHHDGKQGAMVEVNCETDFVARNEDFQELVRDVAMHIAATSPKYLDRTEVPADALEKEKDIQRAQLKEAGKPEAMWEKILVGKLEKFYETVCLVDQYWVKDDKKRIHEMVTERGAKIGEKISIRRFTRFQVGEGIEKKKEDLAAEVAKTLGQA